MNNPAEKSVRDYLNTVQYNAMKLFRVYDVIGRVQYQYDAPVGANDGDTCMRTEYVYDGNTFRVTKMKETLQAWTAAWDV